MQSQYKTVYKNFGIVCNNSVSGGDCYGQTMCACKCFLYDENYFDYYSKPLNKNDLHHDYKCTNCDIIVCGCCYGKCPECLSMNDEQRVELPHSQMAVKRSNKKHKRNKK